jgi:nicotinamide-nucleotide amidase
VVVAEIVSIGTELLMGQIVDTNAQYLAAVFPDYGIGHYHRQTVGDNFDRLVSALRLALSRSDLVFTIGGLGPTEDDITRKAIAAALEDELALDERYAEKLRRLFSQRNLPWLDTQLQQAYHPRSGHFIENPNGTAPGLLCRKNGKTLIALPGPKQEFIPMVEGPIRAFLADVSGGTVLLSETLKVLDMGESMVEEAIRDLIHGSNPSIGIYAHPGEVHIRITASAEEARAAADLLAPVQKAIEARLGARILGGKEATLEGDVLQRLKAKQQTVATAESCTGGMVAARLTDAPGASESVVGGIVSYTLGAKEQALGVRKETLQAHGAVSSQTAQEMAEGVCKALGAYWGISVTGNAGPTESEGKPIGLVYIGVSDGTDTTVEEHHFRGTRAFIRQRAVQAALSHLRRRLLD